MLTPTRQLGISPGDTKIDPGSHLLVFSAPDRVTVRYPLLVRQGETLDVGFEIPRRESIPEGFVYIPPGRFLFGAAGDDRNRKIFFLTVPLHEMKTDGYLIGKSEVTYGEWIEYLKTLEPVERVKRTMHAKEPSTGSWVELNEMPDGHWQISLRLGDKTYVACNDEKIKYKNRRSRGEQDWLRMPVGGITREDAEAYSGWLNQSGRVPGAHLCTEVEWERATRGADGREFPHGERIEPDDANYDDTYGKDLSTVGPDEVGSHPESDSPFGLHDTAGNVNEWVHSTVDPRESSARSGGFYFSELPTVSANRQLVSPTFRDPMGGMRVCADYPPPGRSR